MNQNVGFGASFNGKHTWRDYGLVVSNANVVGVPAPRTLFVDVPGAAKMLDLSEALTGRCDFEPRTLSFTLGGQSSARNWVARLSRFAAEVHGKKVKVILDQEPEYFYEGRAVVKDFDRVGTIGTIEVEVTCDPYKWEISSSGEDWLWDVFNFETGVLREYRNIEISGSFMFDIPGSEAPVAPVFNVSKSNGLRVLSIDTGLDRELPVGRHRFPELVLNTDGLNMLFLGSGTLTIEVRGGAI